MTLQEYKKKSKKNSSKLLSRSLIVVVLLFGVFIAVTVNKDLRDTIEKKLFKTDHNFALVNKIYNRYFLNLFDKKDEEKTIATAATGSEGYDKFKDGVKKKIGKNENIKAFKGGIVVYIGKKEGYGKTVIIQQSDGTDAWYGNLEKVNVKLYDYVEKDTNVGNATDNVYLVFQRDGKFLDYKKAIS